MSQTADELVAQYRRDYPDLTSDEEARIRKHAKTGCGLFLRCTFDYTLSFNAKETQALRDMVEEWIGEGFTTPPYEDAVTAVIEKLGLSEHIPKKYRR